MSARAQELKAAGNKAFVEKDFVEAVRLFSEAIEFDPNDHILYSNRSGAYASNGQYAEALKDAEKCVELKPSWAKGWARKGFAELQLKQYQAALHSYEQGLQADPTNTSCGEGAQQARQLMSKSIPAEQFEIQVALKLSTNPKFAKYMEESPEYLTRVAGLAREIALEQDPQKLQMALTMCPDVRIQEGLMAVFGIEMPNEAPEPTKKKEAAAKAEAEAEKKPPLSPEEQEAEKIKDEGNKLYKERKFDEALDCYMKAFEKNPKEILYLNNVAAVHLERKEFDECLKTCQKALDLRYEVQADFTKVAKVFNRMASCYIKMENYEEAIKCYQKSLCEDNNRHTRAALRDTERLWEKKKAEAYINPELAETHRVRGNDLFKAQQYPEAKIEYDEAIRRSPKDAKLYSNRAAAYMALLEYPSALKDCEKAIELDPSFCKAYARKGQCYIKMKEFHKALPAFQEGLKIDPKNEECQRGLQQAMQTIWQTQQSSEVDEEQVQRAMADEDIQRIFRDPSFQIALETLKSQPERLPEMMKDPKMAAGINKLVAAGILRIR